MTYPSQSEPSARFTPLYEAQQAQRYERQQLIRRYQSAYGCSLVVMSSPIFPWAVTYFEELAHNADPSKDLHLILASSGGDGETAIRLVRSAQEHCKRLVVITPDQAKSAATLIAIGAHEIIMGPTSDLGPIDPQLQLENSLVSAKDLIAAVDDATRRVQDAPETYPLWASMLNNVTAIMVQQARSAIDRSGDLLTEAISANPERDQQKVVEMFESLKGRLIEEPHSHAAVFGADDAVQVGLPVTKLHASSTQWRDIWHLWTRYFSLGNLVVFEGEQASQIFSWG